MGQSLGVAKSYESLLYTPVPTSYLPRTAKSSASMKSTRNDQIGDRHEKEMEDINIEKKIDEPVEQTWTAAEERATVRKLDIYLIAM
jgi:hypothetical protein